MKVKYFRDTDTLLIQLSDQAAVDYVDVSEDVLAELDETGHLVAITVEHAQTQTAVESFLFETIDKAVVAA